MSTSEYIDPYDTSSTDIGHDGHTLKTLFEGMREAFYELVDCLFFSSLRVTKRHVVTE